LSLIIIIVITHTFLLVTNSNFHSLSIIDKIHSLTYRPTLHKLGHSSKETTTTCMCRCRSHARPMAGQVPSTCYVIRHQEALRLYLCKVVSNLFQAHSSGSFPSSQTSGAPGDFTTRRAAVQDAGLETRF
jgi:hypothetical protein